MKSNVFAFLGSGSNTSTIESCTALRSFRSTVGISWLKTMGMAETTSLLTALGSMEMRSFFSSLIIYCVQSGTTVLRLKHLPLRTLYSLPSHTSAASPIMPHDQKKGFTKCSTVAVSASVTATGAVLPLISAATAGCLTTFAFLPFAETARAQRAQMRSSEIFRMKKGMIYSK